MQQTTSKPSLSNTPANWMESSSSQVMCLYKLKVVHFHSFHSFTSSWRNQEHVRVKNTQLQPGKKKWLKDPNKTNARASDNTRGQLQEHTSSHFGLDRVYAGNRSGGERTADVGLSHSFVLHTGLVSHWRTGESPAGPFPEPKCCSGVRLVFWVQVTDICASWRKADPGSAACQDILGICDMVL